MEVKTKQNQSILMSIFDIFIIAIGVAMDAFAVSIAKGLSVKQVEFKHYAKAALWFGGFQALMPLIGYYVGIWFAPIVEKCDHWVAFVLLGIIGGKMIKDSFSDEEDHNSNDFSFKTMLIMAIATSIDALAVGISLAFLKVNIWVAILFIGLITALFSATGIKIGYSFGKRHKTFAEILGGIILVAMAFKILIEHLINSGC